MCKAVEQIIEEGRKEGMAEMRTEMRIKIEASDKHVMFGLLSMGFRIKDLKEVFPHYSEYRLHKIRKEWKSNQVLMR